MVSGTNNSELGHSHTVYGRASQATVDALDQVADQGLLSRSAVITQILETWATRRAAEIRELERNWNPEDLGLVSDLATACEDARQLLAH